MKTEVKIKASPISYDIHVTNSDEQGSLTLVVASSPNEGWARKISEILADSGFDFVAEATESFSPFEDEHMVTAEMREAGFFAAGGPDNPNFSGFDADAVYSAMEAERLRQIQG